MPTSGEKTAEQAKTASLIFKQIRRRDNAQYLGRMPVFEVPKGLSCHLEALLSELDRAEEEELKPSGRSEH
jgi:hypothetical protein